MAASDAQTRQHTGTDFVESAGAILFQTSSRKICLLHFLEKDEWLLSKGRRNIGESRRKAALREAEEETGFKCRLLPVTLTSRAPPAVETDNTLDGPWKYESVCEPFMLTHRWRERDGLKTITWYIAAIEEDVPKREPEPQYEVQTFDFNDAVQKLTFQADREVLRRAIEIYFETFGDA